MRLAALALIAWAVASCSDPVSSSGRVVGTYELVALDGQPLPAPWPTISEVTEATMTLEGGLYKRSYQHRNLTDDSRFTIADSGSFHVDGSDVVLSSEVYGENGGPWTTEGSFEDGALYFPEDAAGLSSLWRRP